MRSFSIKRFVLVFGLLWPTIVWGSSDDEGEGAESEESSLEAKAAEARALELLGEESEEPSPEMDGELNLFIEEQRGEVGTSPPINTPLESTPSSPIEAPETLHPGWEDDLPKKEGILDPEHLEDESKKTKERNFKGSAWKQQYYSGRELTKTGYRVGAVGAGVTVGGIVVAGVLSGSGGYEGLIVGGLVAASGLGVMWGGSAFAAAGTYRSYSALAKADIAGPVCIGCVGAWATAIYPLTVPISYVLSAATQSTLYEAYKQGGHSGAISLRMSPIVTRSGPGLGVNGTF